MFVCTIDADDKALTGEPAMSAAQKKAKAKEMAQQAKMEKNMAAKAKKGPLKCTDARPSS